MFSLESPLMSAHNIPFSDIKQENHSKLSQICSSLSFSKGLKNEFEATAVNEPSVFEPLKFYRIFYHYNRYHIAIMELILLHQMHITIASNLES